MSVNIHSKQGVKFLQIGAYTATAVAASVATINVASPNSHGPNYVIGIGARIVGVSVVDTFKAIWPVPGDITLTDAKIGGRLYRCNYDIWQQYPDFDGANFYYSATIFPTGNLQVPVPAAFAVGDLIELFYICIAPTKTTVATTDVNLLQVSGDATAVSAANGVKVNVQAVNSASIAANQLPVDIKLINGDSTKLVAGQLGVNADIKAQSVGAISVNLTHSGGVQFTGTNIPVDLKVASVMVDANIAAVGGAVGAVAGYTVPANLTKVNNNAITGANVPVDLKAVGANVVASDSVPVNVARIGGSSGAIGSGNLPVDIKYTNGAILPSNNLPIDLKAVNATAVATSNVPVDIKRVNNVALVNATPALPVSGASGGGDVNIVSVQGVPITDGKVPIKTTANAAVVDYNFPNG